MLQVTQTIPILRIADARKARDFYVNFLGFRVDWERQFDPTSPVYMQVSRGGCVLHLSAREGDGCAGATVMLKATGLQGYELELRSHANNGVRRPELGYTGQGTIGMEIVDPFGNRLRFDEAAVPVPMH